MRLRRPGDQRDEDRSDQCLKLQSRLPTKLNGVTLTIAQLEALVAPVWKVRSMTQAERAAAAAGGALDDVADWFLAREFFLAGRPEVQGGVLADECAALLTRFFQSRR